MAGKSNTIVGIDIGTSKIAVAVGEAKDDGQVEVTGVGTAPSKGLRKGVVINIEATVSSISKAVAEAETMAGCDLSSVFASISGGHIKGINSHGIVGIRNKEVTSYDIEKVIEAAKAVAIPLDREVLHVLPQEFIIDEQDGIRDPLGMSGVRLEARVHMVTGSVTSAENIVKCANRCGLTVDGIVLAPLASGSAVVSAEERELGACLIDIGSGTVDLTVFHGGAVKHTAVLSVGGNHLTNDIAAGLRTPIAAAEKIKCEYGTALTSLVSGEDTIEVPSTGGRVPRVLSKLVLSEIIEPRIEEIFSLIHGELVRSGFEELLTSGLVLAGGTANLHGIVDVAEQVFNLPVRVGEPTGVSGLSDMVAGPQYATAVGLLLYGAEQVKRAGFRSLRSTLLGRIKRKVNDWLG